MDSGRESRAEKDAMTVEIMFALVTGAALGALVFAAFLVPVLVLDASRSAREVLLTVGAVPACGAAVWRVVRVLLRFDARRRLGR
ncbi:DUF6332 family protein [Streptomyces sp. NPDC102406]|uniref:DUF6332 family protein n=1 Tax=Streptomyces sp. NPDC102406 TaxID=3366171 RepID=UPI003810E4D2